MESATPGYCTLTATSVPSGKVARWTCKGCMCVMNVSPNTKGERVGGPAVRRRACGWCRSVSGPRTRTHPHARARARRRTHAQSRHARALRNGAGAGARAQAHAGRWAGEGGTSPRLLHIPPQPTHASTRGPTHRDIRRPQTRARSGSSTRGTRASTHTRSRGVMARGPPTPRTRTHTRPHTHAGMARAPYSTRDGRRGQGPPAAANHRLEQPGAKKGAGGGLPPAPAAARAPHT